MHGVTFVVLIHLAILYLLIGKFSSFIFKVCMDRYGCTTAILQTELFARHFYIPFLLLLLSFFVMCREAAEGTEVVGDMLSSVVNAIGIQHRSLLFCLGL